MDPKSKPAAPRWQAGLLAVLALALVAAGGLWLHFLWQGSAANASFHLVKALKERDPDRFVQFADMDAMVADGLAQMNAANSRSQGAVIGGLVNGLVSLMNTQIINAFRAEIKQAVASGLFLGEPPEAGDRAGIVGQIASQSQFAGPFLRRPGCEWLTALYVLEHAVAQGDATILELNLSLPKRAEAFPLRLEFRQRDGVMRLARIPNLFALLGLLAKGGAADIHLQGP